MGKLKNSEGNSLSKDAAKVAAFQAYNLISNHPHTAHTHNPPVIASSPAPFRHADEKHLNKVQKALSKTWNNSTPGTDRIAYQLIKLIKDIPLGKGVINETALSIQTTGPKDWRDLNMVMIPKTNKDHTLVKGWHPIALSNTVGKLVEKVVVDSLQSQNSLFLQLQYDSRKGGSAIDAIILTTSEAEQASWEGKQATLLGKDIHCQRVQQREER